jgi:transposase
MIVAGSASGQEGWVVGVEQWAKTRRMHFVGGVSIKEIARRTGRDRNTVRRALRADTPPGYRRAPAESKLDAFREEIRRLLKDDPKLSGVRPGVDRAVGVCGLEDDPARLSA